MPTPFMTDAFEQLCDKLGVTFPEIQRARKQSKEKLSELRHLAQNGATDDCMAVSVVPPDGSLVVLGSLARAEWTSGSDVDWTLLIDGQADPQHNLAAKEFAARLQDGKYKKPGPAGVFGGLSFSHDLIHCIGGEHDTNTNMTRRVLLLLESRSLTTVDAHSRVIRGILKRYLDSERTFLTDSGRKYKVPRFLLNDIVRYWRTVAVDYVNKQWERGDEGWALRNIKLRFSRKLMFVSGLLTCFSCYLDTHGRTEVLFRDEDEAARTVHQHVVSRMGMQPIDVLCAHLASRAKAETANKLLVAYDFFLAIPDNPEKRKHLSGLQVGSAYQDEVFNTVRKQSRNFQEALSSMFYEDDQDTTELMLKYGVF